MIGLLTARAEIEIFGKIKEKEDILPIEFEREGNNILFRIRKSDFIFRLVKESQVFAINTPRLNFERERDLCKIHEGEFEDKFKLTGFEKKECTSIDCPSIDKSDVMECLASRIEENKENAIIHGKILKESRL